MIPLAHFMYVSLALLGVGIYLVITRKNALLVLIGIELILNAANINLVSAGNHKGHDGWFFSVFVMVVAVCESAIALAILYRAYGAFKTSELDKISDLKL